MNIERKEGSRSPERRLLVPLITQISKEDYTDIRIFSTYSVSV